ncbi:hypothetical protein GWK47_008468 [Chionoecetes opilio]|uniref:Uncharacterized protein n=1 Tax=Chionoecetes opilio TaxID=41210 RepID=A0A8J4XZN7_CHIOP|nr:hypothetical protein GWK47_008468 [Chionoecetes opilio]
MVRLLNPEKVDAVKSRLLFEVTEQAVLDTSEGSNPDKDEEDDFFKVLAQDTSSSSSPRTPPVPLPFRSRPSGSTNTY